MSQAHVAFLLGTQQPNISAYERGTLEPGALVDSRIRAFLALTPATAHRGTWAGTLASHAITLSGLLGTERGPGRDHVVIRHVVAMNDAWAALTLPEDRALFLAEPSGTGRADLDDLLAGLAVHWSRAAGLERTPAWTRHRHSRPDTVWWVGLDERQSMARARAFAHGIPALRARGIFLDRATLESV